MSSAQPAGGSDPTRPADHRAIRAGVVVLVSAALFVAVLLTRDRPVEVALPDAAGSAACSAGGQRWPSEVADVDSRPTDPADPALAAWGDPPLVARCGVPALGPTEEQCIAVGGVDWVAEPLSDGTRLTTFGRDPAIELLVPAEMGPAPLLLPAFAPAARELPTNGSSCS